MDVTKSSTTSGDAGRESARSPLSRWTVPVVAFIVLSAAVLTLVALWQWIDGLTLASADKKAAAQLDAVKVAASIAVGGGGLFALYLAARRLRIQELELAQRERVQAHVEAESEHNQRHADRVAADARTDAAARLLTELYAKSVEQLGSDKAPVRLGGLYALERLAQDNEHQRQTIVNVLCAYLRMPYQIPDETSGNDGDQSTREAQLQEREVRLTAQQIILKHLRRNLPSTWKELSVDLTGATLIDFAVLDSDIAWSSFKKCKFFGSTLFMNTSLPRYANFEGAHFFGGTHFVSVTFKGDARFRGVTFYEAARFGGLMQQEEVTFSGSAKFEGTTFWGIASFPSAVFIGPASFGKLNQDTAAIFNGEAYFGETAFRSSANFNGVQFLGEAYFRKSFFSARGPSGPPKFGAATTDFRSTIFAEGIPAEVIEFTTVQHD
ncbi:hypothetical protein DMP23_43615 [Amycolatopsis sp. A1MSW2902]|uniref:pentapeptide repeat-containing protein n=1 Tax=Amycolatopsis sp. A1MSW2902 TaxID=687413 RepID=UPI00307DE259